MMALFCIKPTATLISDAKRAELLRWLLDNNYALDLSAVNAQLQTPVHCAVQSRSLEVLEVKKLLPSGKMSIGAKMNRSPPARDVTMTMQISCWQGTPGSSPHVGE